MYLSSISDINLFAGETGNSLAPSDSPSFVVSSLSAAKTFWPISSLNNAPQDVPLFITSENLSFTFYQRLVYCRKLLEFCSKNSARISCSCNEIIDRGMMDVMLNKYTRFDQAGLKIAMSCAGCYFSRFTRSLIGPPQKFQTRPKISVVNFTLWLILSRLSMNTSELESR